jgi:hypothetical protein
MTISAKRRRAYVTGTTHDANGNLFAYGGTVAHNGKYPVASVAWDVAGSPGRLDHALIS